MKFKKINFNKGFTLVELLVVIGIMATLAAVIFPNVTQYNSTQTLNQAANSFISILRAAQTNAISGALCGNQLSPTNKASYWSFRADPSLTKYYYHPNCVDSSGNTLTGTPVPEYDFNYNTGVILSSIQALDNNGNVLCSPKSSPTNGIATEFSNISGAVSFNYETTAPDGCHDPYPSTPIQKLRYTLSTTDGTALFYVYVDRGGSIYSLAPTPTP